MRPRTLVLTALFLIMSSSAVASLRTRTFVSSMGVDSADCQPTAPCRTFAYAITQTTANGQIVAVDTAGFGAVTITKSITIMAVPGALASIAADSSAAADVVINAGPADTVRLSNIVFDTTGTMNGISFNAGGVLHVDDSTFMNFGSAAIYVYRTTASDTSSVFIEDVTFRDLWQGVHLETNDLGAKVSVAINRSSFRNYSSSALEVRADCKAVVRDSMFTSTNSGTGVAAFGTQGPAEVLLEHTSVSNSAIGVRVSGGAAIIRVSDSSIIDNGVGLQYDLSGQIRGLLQGTIGTNTVEGNNAGNDFTEHYTSK